MHRRQFLQAISAAGTAAAARFSRAAEESTPSHPDTFTLGFSLYGMRKLPLSAALQTCADIGYDNVELVCTSDWPCDPATFSSAARRETRKQLSDLGLGLPSLMENLTLFENELRHRQNLNRLKAACELGHDLRPDAPPVIETVLGGRPGDWELKRSEMVDALGDWAGVAQENRVLFAIKAHVGGALHTSKDAKWLVDQIASPWIRLTYDYSHFQLGGETLENSLAMMIADTAFIHVKDARGTSEKFQFLLPGEGDVDYATYFRLLRNADYRGSVMVEVSGQLHGKPDYDPKAAAEKSFAVLKTARQQVLQQPAEKKR